MVKYDITSINSKGVNKIVKGSSKMDLSQELDKIIAKLKARVEKEIPDTGYFRNFAENFEKGKKPDIYARDISLFIERDEARDGRAYLGVSVLHPEINIDAASYIMNGDRNKILEYMNNKDFKEELQKAVLELSESLKNVK